MSTALEGGCLCGAVRYRIGAEPLAQSLCHCRSCRLAAGASPVAWMVVRAADFSLISGAPVRFESSPGVERTFCGKCGTALTYQDSSQSMDVTVCSLDRPEVFAPAREVWIARRVPWVVPLAGVAQFEASSSKPPSSA
jgi:hypothetical protein